ncbi:primosomal protein DnaI [Paludifilum halophilum]|uniref:Primosomal protein DnaI n=1 Tax=Paludifilum halophilum TaxID=1642702 RepID=A0A235B7V6_9BACL|nr:primosomal protein DnaI [Paludifilum halophilum]OYD08376.1 hypothetical protein CHM34_05945 [Paludifilum halophilum]
MDRIDKVVSPLKRKAFQRVDPAEQIRRLKSHPRLRAFREANPDLPESFYRRSAVQLREYIREWENCSQCPGLDRCPNLVSGHQPELHVYGGTLDVRMGPCRKWLARREEIQRHELVKSHYIPQDILDATFESITPNPGRLQAIEGALDFCEKFADGRPRRGLYLYGGFGVGKSRIAAAIAQNLVNYDVDSFMVYVPEFMREIKESIRDGMVNEKLDTLKKATVLILDDIGAENLTPWTRDEVLGAVLQYRMAERLPTVMTSNLDLNELEAHLARSEKGGTEKTKAKRIMERIRPHVDAYLLEGPNRREQP